MSPQKSAIPAHAQLIQMAIGCWISRLVSTATNLSIADHLAHGPKAAQEIAEATGTNPRALHRFMRTLANFGILTHAADQKLALTPLGDALQTDAPGSARSTILVTDDFIIIERICGRSEPCKHGAIGNLAR